VLGLDVRQRENRENTIMIQRRTVGIIGCGNVGAAAAYSMFHRDLASDIIYVDKDERRAEGEAMDLMHAQALHENINVRSGPVDDLSEAQVIVISAGSARKEGETRLDLLLRNVAIFRQIVADLDRHAPEAILVVATNPVDIITHVIQKLSIRPRERVIGTGTMLDTARFRAVLGQYYGVDPRDVHAYILGEHGDSEVPVWSSMSIGGQRPIEREVLGKVFDAKEMDDLFQTVRYAGREVIARKGFTSAAIGVVIAQLVETVLDDQHSVLTVSVELEGEYGFNDVVMSIPCVVGHSGVEGRVLPSLNDQEMVALRHSADVLRESIESINL
jgi:L-lactate dehydrogenase